MRARRKKMKRFKDMVPEIGLRAPRWKSFENMLSADPEIEREIAERDNAIENAVSQREAYNYRRAGTEADVPLIAGYTDAANATPEMKMAGYLDWLGKSAQQRYEDSALGQSEQFSMEGPSPGKAVYSDMARGNSYWAGLARNIGRGSAMPEASLEFSGHRYGGVEGEQLPGLANERLQGAATPPDYSQWSRIPYEEQQKIARYAEQNGLTVEEVLDKIRGGR